MWLRCDGCGISCHARNVASSSLLLVQSTTPAPHKYCTRTSVFSKTQANKNYLQKQKFDHKSSGNNITRVHKVYYKIPLSQSYNHCCVALTAAARSSSLINLCSKLSFSSPSIGSDKVVSKCLL